MDWRAMFKGAFISAAEFDGRTPTLTIAEVKLHPVFDEKLNKDRNKGTVWFRETDRGFVLCRTNAACLAAMFGPDTTQWIGRRVTLYAADVQFGRERVLGVRVKGSPDLARPIAAEVKLPRRKAFTMRMEVTGRGNGTPPAEPPPHDDAPPPSGPHGPDGEREPGADG